MAPPGPAMYHYQNYKAYIPETIGVRKTSTIEFFLDKVETPSTSSADRLAAAATKDLVAALQDRQHHSLNKEPQLMMQLQN